MHKQQAQTKVRICSPSLADPFILCNWQDGASNRTSPGKTTSYCHEMYSMSQDSMRGQEQIISPPLFTDSQKEALLQWLLNRYCILQEGTSGC